MSKQQVEKLIGPPDYSGGYIASVLPGKPYTSQYSRYILFYVYPDNSLVVFRKDTVVEIKADSEAFLRHLEHFAKNHQQQRKAAKPE